MEEIDHHKSENSFLGRRSRSSSGSSSNLEKSSTRSSTVIGEVAFNAKIFCNISLEKVDGAVAIKMTDSRFNTALGKKQGDHVISHRLILELCATKIRGKDVRKISSILHNFFSSTLNVDTEPPEILSKYSETDRRALELLKTIDATAVEIYKLGLRAKRNDAIEAYLNMLVEEYSRGNEVVHERTGNKAKNEGIETHASLIAMRAIDEFLSYKDPISTEQKIAFAEKCLMANGEFVDGMRKIFPYKEIKSIRKYFQLNQKNKFKPSKIKAERFFNEIREQINFICVAKNIEAFFDYPPNELNPSVEDLYKQASKCLHVALSAFPNIKAAFAQNEAQLIVEFLKKVAENQKWELEGLSTGSQAIKEKIESFRAIEEAQQQQQQQQQERNNDDLTLNSETRDTFITKKARTEDLGTLNASVVQQQSLSSTISGSNNHNNNLAKSEKSVISKASQKTKPKFIEVLTKDLPENQKNFINALKLEIKPEELLEAININNKNSKNTKITFMSESDHKKDHILNVKKLVEMITSNQIDSNTVICIERKEEGQNFGMNDVKLLAKLLEYNNSNPEESRILINDQIIQSPIYQDAILYNAAKEKNIKVIGIEGKGLQYSKESPEYNTIREKYMANQIMKLKSEGNNIILTVGSNHVKNLNARLAQSSSIEEIKSINPLEPESNIILPVLKETNRIIADSLESGSTRHNIPAISSNSQKVSRAIR